MKIRYTKHAKNKFLYAEELKWNLNEKDIEKAIQNPDFHTIDESTHDLTVGVSSRSRTSSDILKPSILQLGFYRDKLKQRLRLFGLDKFNPILNNHALKGRYSGFRSINITGDLRAIYKQVQEDVIFATIDSHSNLYS